MLTVFTSKHYMLPSLKSFDLFRRALITRAESVEKKIGDKITAEIRKSLSTAQTLDEIEDIVSDYDSNVFQ